MAVSVDAAARRICEIGGWRVTNLALQKILYIIHMVRMGRTGGERLVNSAFEAWDYGPVEPSLYRRVAMFGDRPVQNIFGARSIDGLPEAVVIDEGAPELVTKRPSELVAITHWKRGAWARNYKAGIKGIVIPDRDILAEYEARVESG